MYMGLETLLSLHYVHMCDNMLQAGCTVCHINRSTLSYCQCYF